MNFGDTAYYPDFTILHPVTLKIFYCEHFGLFDSESYVRRAFDKLSVYVSHGLVPTVNLICTYETADVPLDPAYVQKLISYYFL